MVNDDTHFLPVPNTRNLSVAYMVVNLIYMGFLHSVDCQQILSHMAKKKDPSSVSHTSPMHAFNADGPEITNKGANWKRRRARRKNIRTSTVLFYNAVDGSASDTKSFDEDDMYGSDSDVDTISLKPHSDIQPTITSEKSIEQPVCNLTYCIVSSISHITSMPILSLNWIEWI